VAPTSGVHLSREQAVQGELAAMLAPPEENVPMGHWLIPEPAKPKPG